MVPSPSPQERDWDSALKKGFLVESRERAAWVPLSTAMVMLLLGLASVATRPWIQPEAQRWLQVRHGLLELFTQLTTSTLEPPLYSWVAGALLMVGDLNTLRLFSLLCGTLAVFLLTHRLTKLLGEPQAWMFGFLLATSPFLQFAFSHGDSQGMLALLLVTTGLFAERFFQKPTALTALNTGLFSALVLQTDYFAGVLVVIPLLVGILLWCVKEGRTVEGLAALAPPWISALAWSPFLLNQLDAAALAPGGGGWSVVGWLRIMALLLASFAGGDALPVWTFGGLAVALMLLGASAAGLWKVIRAGTRGRIVAGVLLLLFLLITAAGSALQFGSEALLFPRTLGWFFLLGYLVVMGIPLALNRAPNALLVLIGVSHGIGLVAHFATRGHTSWEHGIPSGEIAAQVLAIKEEHPGSLVLVDRRKLAVVEWELERLQPGSTTRSCPPQGPLIVVSTADSPAWPLTDAFQAEFNCIPYFEPQLLKEEPLQPLPRGMARMHATLFGETPPPHRVVIRVMGQSE